MAERVFAVVGLFNDAPALLAAVERLRKGGAGPLMAYTPHEVRGLAEALGLRRSPVAGLALLMGVLGALTAVGLQGWMNAVDYPLRTGGKALFSWQAFVPIMFELTVLFASFAAWLGALFVFGRLFSLDHPMLRSRAMAAITRDKYALAVEGGGRPVDAALARAALEGAGAAAVETVPCPVPRPPARLSLLMKALLLGGGVCAGGGLAMYCVIKAFPAIPPMVHMEDQPYLQAQRPSAFFADGSGMRPPPEGGAARGRQPYPFKAAAEAERLLADPLPRTEAVLKLGQRVYAEYCWKCHGAVGDGVPTLTPAYGGKPADLQRLDLRRAPDARLFDAATAGKDLMPAYGWALTEDERWAAVHYVRVLQRAQNAGPGDLR